MLIEWNEKINLVSYKSITELLIDHIIDSFSIMECYRFTEKIISDIGTGAGLPGIVLSILYPSCQYVLIEPNKKYYRFLKKVIISLKLKNVELINRKVESIDDPNSLKVVISRALGEIRLFLNMTVLKRTKVLIFYKGINCFKELHYLGLPDHKIMFIKKIKILEKYNKNHYIIALKKR